VSFAAIALCVASQRVFIVVGVYFVIDSVRNFWIHPRNSANEPGCMIVEAHIHESASGVMSVVACA
jgi:hypothetical protein